MAGMPASWPDHLFDRTSPFARPAAVAAVWTGYLAFFHRPAGWADVAFAGVAVLVSLAGGFAPLAAALALSALLPVAGLAGSAVVVGIKVSAAVVLFELALRGSTRAVALAGSALAVAVFVTAGDAALSDTASVLFRVVMVVGAPLLLGGYVRSLRDRRREAEEHRAEVTRRRESELRAARARERTAIARELHDLVAHHVSSMVLRVGVARHVVPDADPRLAAVLDDLHTSGTAALADLRGLVAVLRDPETVHDDGVTAPIAPARLPEAVAAAAAASRRLGLAVEARVDPAAGAVDAVRAQAVLRIVQEGLANAAKHAGAGTRVRVTVAAEPGNRVRVSVTDDGAGSAPPAPAPGGHGIAGMRERVGLLGGDLVAGADAGGGWRLVATLPGRARSPEAAP